MTEEEIIPEAEPELPNEGGDGEGVTKVTTDPSGDPLDKISDIETLRHEAKKFRAIGVRKTKDESPSTPAPVVQAKVVENSNYVTKEDMLRIATKEAKGLVSEETRNVWDELHLYVPPKYRGAETKEELVKAYEIAFITYKADHPSSPESNASDLATITTPGSGGMPKTTTKPTDEDPRFKKPPSPEEWYPKKK